MRLIIISNRLPITLCPGNRLQKLTESIGGLASGMRSIIKNGLSGLLNKENCLWFGWPGSYFNPREAREVADILKSQYKCYAVFLSSESIKRFYNGFCNQVLYPMFLGFRQYVHFDENDWLYYVKVNEIYGRLIAKELREGDIIWVNDYHLLLLPAIIRKYNPLAQIRFFLHIPFPDINSLGCLPPKISAEIVAGMAGADLIGFHVEEYRLNFENVARTILNVDISNKTFQFKDRIVKTGCFPMGIDYTKYHCASDTSSSPPHSTRMADLKYFLSVDRLDYTKGITNKLSAFEVLIERFQGWRNKTKLLLFVVPSRTEVMENQILRMEIEKSVAAINRAYGNANWQPIEYHYCQLDFEDLTRVYSMADIALVTPIKDGMNLVAKEFITSRPEGDGVLILSKNAGAKEELTGALLVDPINISEMSKCMLKALQMPLREQKIRTKKMQETLQRYDIFRWAEDVLQITEEKICHDSRS